jgi:hypothetical protein
MSLWTPVADESSHAHTDGSGADLEFLSVAKPNVKV